MISITIPIYNELDTLEELHGEITDTMLKIERPYEIIFVNDGSTDGSEVVLDMLAEQDPSVIVVHLQRNFGQTAAMMAGFERASGDIVVPMDGDGQNDPSDIPLLLEKLDKGFDMCSGWRRQRKDPFLARRLVSVVANKIVSFMTGVKLHDYGCSFKAYRKDVIKNVRLYGEMHRFIPIYAHWEGARITEVEVNHRPRRYGKSNYGLERTYKFLFDLMVVMFMDRFLGKPLYLFGGFGVLNFLVAFIAVSASVWFKIWGDKSFIETPLPLLAVMTFITGTMCILMGLLAEMIIRIFYEIQSKKNYVISRVNTISRKKIIRPKELTGVGR